MQSTKDQIAQKFTRGGFCQFTERGRSSLQELTQAVAANKIAPLVGDYKLSTEWTVGQKSRLIESFLLNIPVPPLVLFSGGYTSTTVLIDGEQRLNAICEFLANKFSLWDLSQWPELHGLYFGDLPYQMTDHLRQRKLTTLTILKDDMSAGVPNAVLSQIAYEHLNFARI